MDRAAHVDGPFKRLGRPPGRGDREPPPYPAAAPIASSPDPPWPYELLRGFRTAHSPMQMSIAEICAESEKVKRSRRGLHSVAVTHSMREAFVVLNAWGFEPRRSSPGRRTVSARRLAARPNRALLIRGARQADCTASQPIDAPPRPAAQNSQKPEEFYALVERLADTALLQRRRRARENWDGHGDEYVAEAAG